MGSGRLSRCVLAALLCAAFVAPESAAAVVRSDAFATDAPKDSVYTEMAIHPQGLYTKGRTIVAWQGSKFDPYVSAYRHDTKTWSPTYRAGVSTLVNDLHGAPALLEDRNGYIHVFWGGHHSPMYHARTTRPGDISAWTRMADVAPVFTYPQPIMLPDGTIDIFYRGLGTSYTGDGQDWVYKRSTDNGVTWKGPYRVLDQVGDLGFYANFSKGQGGEILCAYTSVEWPLYLTKTAWGRRHVYFMRRDAAGTWRNTAGTALTVPLTKVQADGKTRIVNTGSAYANQVLVKPAPDGDPCVQFSNGSGHGPGSYPVRFMRLDSGAWSSSEVGRMDFFYDAATFAFERDGTLRSYLAEGGTKGKGSGDWDPIYEDDGGLIQEHVSADGGATWTTGTVISPPVPEGLFNNPMTIQDATGTARVMFQEWSTGSSLNGFRVYLHGDDGLLGRDMTPAVTRIAGANRYDVAIKTSREAFPHGSRSAVIVNSTAFADAAAAAPLAYALDGPILLSGSAALDSRAAAELKRLKPRRVLLVGGTGSLSDRVKNSVRSTLPLANVERIAGPDRYSTAAAVSKRLTSARRSKPDAVVVVKGSAFPDALMASPWAAYRGRPILLVERNWMPPATAAALRDLGATRTIVVGDESSVGLPVFRILPSPVRIAGSTRYDTSARVAQASLADGLLEDRMVVAGGWDFADPLAASILAARLRAPMLLSSPTALHPEAAAVLSAAEGTTIKGYVVGGTSSVSAAVERQVRSLLGAP